jgi:hypothetical protein
MKQRQVVCVVEFCGCQAKIKDDAVISFTHTLFRTVSETAKRKRETQMMSQTAI